MNRLVSASFVVVGVFVALFYVALLGIADCSEGCKARGEQAPVFAFIGSGLGLVAVGSLGIRFGTWRAVGAGLLVAGVVTTAGNANIARQFGVSGVTLLALAAGILAFGVGALMLRPRAPRI